MTIQITYPTDGSTVDITAKPVAGKNDTGDEVAGFIWDLDNNVVYPSTNESLSSDGSGGWDWTLAFQFDPPKPTKGDTLLVFIYDAETGGDGDSVTVQQLVDVAAPAAPAAFVPAVAVHLGGLAGNAVQDINLNVTLPAGMKGTVFLVLTKTIGGPTTSPQLILQQHLPPLTKGPRPVTFRKIDAGYWDHIHSIVVYKRHHGGKPHVTTIK